MEKRRLDYVVTGYIFDGEKRLLFIHHAKLDMWLPVGGHIEANETPDAALLREIREETGLNVMILGRPDIKAEENTRKILATPFHVNVHSVGDHDHCSFYYVCRTRDPDKLRLNDEARGYMWMRKEELDDARIALDIRSIAVEAYKLIE